MKIRTITVFTHPGWPLDVRRLAIAAQLAGRTRQRLEDAGYEVQTVRLAAPPFAHLSTETDHAAWGRYAQDLESAAAQHGFSYVSLGPALPHLPHTYPLAAEIIAATENVFTTGLMTTGEGGVSLPATRACAAVIRRLAPLSPDGFANLRFAALANVAAGTPFLPAAFAPEDVQAQPAFALATEAADLAVQAVSAAATLGEARRRLIAEVERRAAVLQSACLAEAHSFPARFLGLDFTLAPFPSLPESFGAAMEGLGLPAVGGCGSTAAAAFLADSLDRAQYQRVGFNGLMLPVLEDACLAQRAAEGVLTVKDLLLFSTVCGAGLDTVPLPGDVTEAQIAALLLDVAVLAQRLGKPLTARLMPIPGKRAGEPTSFDFGFFANSRVMALEAEPLSGLLAGDEEVSFTPRRPRMAGSAGLSTD